MGSISSNPAHVLRALWGMEDVYKSGGEGVFLQREVGLICEHELAGFPTTPSQRAERVYRLSAGMRDVRKAVKKARKSNRRKCDENSVSTTTKRPFESRVSVL